MLRSQKRGVRLTYDEILAGGDEVLEVLHADHDVGIFPDGLIQTTQNTGHGRPVGRDVNTLVFVNFSKSFVQPPEEINQDWLHGNLHKVEKSWINIQGESETGGV